MRCFAWNPNGIRALLRNGHEDLKKFLIEYQPDVLFFPETKGNRKSEAEINKALADLCQQTIKDGKFEFYHTYFDAKPGRHGCSAIVNLSKVCVHEVVTGDPEGRVLGFRLSPSLQTPSLQTSSQTWVYGVYVPNASTGLKRLDFKEEWIKNFTSQLMERSKQTQVDRILVIGDINVAPDERDICNPSANLNSPGYTPKERQVYRQYFEGQCGLIDVWRMKNPAPVGKSQGHNGVYTFWNLKSRARDRNAGWRIDLCLASANIATQECFVCPQFRGSDHCPVGVVLETTVAVP